MRRWEDHSWIVIEDNWMMPARGQNPLWGGKTPIVHKCSSEVTYCCVKNKCFVCNKEVPKSVTVKAKLLGANYFI